MKIKIEMRKIVSLAFATKKFELYIWRLGWLKIVPNGKKARYLKLQYFCPFPFTITSSAVANRLQRTGPSRTAA